MTIHEIRTSLAPAEVIDRALDFFAFAGTPYAAQWERVGEGSVKLHLEVGEVVIGTVRDGDSTRVRGSASRGAHLLTRFLTTLAPPLGAAQRTRRHGLDRSRGARVEVLAGGAPAELSAAAPAQAA